MKHTGEVQLGDNGIALCKQAFRAKDLLTVDNVYFIISVPINVDKCYLGSSIFNLQGTYLRLSWLVVYLHQSLIGTVYEISVNNVSTFISIKHT